MRSRLFPALAAALLVPALGILLPRHWAEHACHPPHACLHADAAPQGLSPLGQGHDGPGDRDAEPHDPADCLLCLHADTLHAPPPPPPAVSILAPARPDKCPPPLVRAVAQPLESRSRGPPAR